jgi:hypothetical protein
MHRELFNFGTAPPLIDIDLSKIKDVMTKDQPMFSFVTEPENELPDGRAFMFSCMKRAPRELQLIDENGVWNTDGVKKYLASKERFLKLLMLGIFLRVELGLTILAMYLTGGQPVRGSELGVVKFRNTRTTTRNFFATNGAGFYVTEYHKSRASTNHSFNVVRYLPERVTKVVLSYLVYIRPFARVLNTRGKTNPRDVGYLFCSNRSPDKCWKGDVLSRVLQQESLARLKVKLNLWSARHIIIAVTKVHVKDIACYFSMDDEACEEILSKNPDYNIFAFQSGHQRQINLQVYGLNSAYPARLQPEILAQYRRISRLWHRWLGLLTDGKEPGTPVKKRKMMVDADTQTTPKKIGHSLDIEEDMADSPETKKLKRGVKDAVRLLEMKKEGKELRKRLMGSLL